MHTVAPKYTIGDIVDQNYVKDNRFAYLTFLGDLNSAITNDPECAEMGIQKYIQAVGNTLYKQLKGDRK